MSKMEHLRVVSTRILKNTNILCIRVNFTLTASATATYNLIYMHQKGAQWLSGRAKDRGFEPHRRLCVVSLSKNINPTLVLVQLRKTRPFITERLLMGRKESNQTKHAPETF